MLPVRVVATTIVYRDGTGTPVQLVEPNIHHRNETLSGLADPMLLGAFSADRWHALTVRGGSSIPLGRTEDRSVRARRHGHLPHEHIQMGTGTINPVVAAEAVAVAW